MSSCAAAELPSVLGRALTGYKTVRLSLDDKHKVAGERPRDQGQRSVYRMTDNILVVGRDQGLS